MNQFLPREDVVTPATDERVKSIITNGFSVLDPADFSADLTPDRLSALVEFWNDLPLDEELVDGGVYRQRRFGRLVIDVGETGMTATLLPHAPFRQSATHIPLYGGRERMFAPASPDCLMHPAMLRIVGFDTYIGAALCDISSWLVNLHLIRIIAASNSVGLPTPEGKHRDGHKYVGMHLMNRQCGGGESIVYRDGKPPVRLTLHNPMESLMVDDFAVLHEVTPITATAAGQGVRDMLLVDMNPA